MNFNGFGTEVIDAVAVATSSLIVYNAFSLRPALVSESLATQSSSLSFNNWSSSLYNKVEIRI
jgi:hypothetical protein